MGFYVLVSVLILMVCVLLIFGVLVQNSKGGGLAANFSGSQVMGVRKTADFLEKATWTLAISLLVLSLIGSAVIPRGSTEGRSRIEQQIDNAIDPTQVPNLPTAFPEESSSDEE
jgi:preprotein translocase subunit SecG